MVRQENFIDQSLIPGRRKCVDYRDARRSPYFNFPITKSGDKKVPHRAGPFTITIQPASMKSY